MAEDFDILSKVKIALGITGEFQDDTLTCYIDEVKEFLLDAGIIARGVADLWNYGAGNAELSPYFMQRATQLSYKTNIGGDSNGNLD